MIDDHALYVRHGDAFVGTGCTRGSWHANGQSGGAVLALLGHVLEDVPTLTPMSLARLTVDMVRPVPAGEPLEVQTSVLREGKKIQVVDLAVTIDGGELVRARALRVRDADLRGVEGLPAATTDGPGASVELPSPDEGEGVDHHPGVADFLRYGAEMRRTSAPNGQHGVWVRFRVPVIEGEEIRATSRVALPMDCVNLIGVSLTGMHLVSAINPDVSAHVFRPPVGEWTGMLGGTHFSYDVGHGLSMATLQDADGVFGVTSTSQIVELLAQPRRL